jgi:hypothetical protein
MNFELIDQIKHSSWKWFLNYVWVIEPSFSLFEIDHDLPSHVVLFNCGTSWLSSFVCGLFWFSMYFFTPMFCSVLHLCCLFEWICEDVNYLFLSFLSISLCIFVVRWKCFFFFFSILPLCHYSMEWILSYENSSSLIWTLQKVEFLTTRLLYWTKIRTLHYYS